MRRGKLALLIPMASLIALVFPVAAAGAPADNHATSASGQATTTYTCYPYQPQAFNVTLGTVVNKQTTTTLADGTPIPGGVMHFVVAPSGAYVTTFSLKGTQQNGCALLSR